MFLYGGQNIMFPMQQTLMYFPLPSETVSYRHTAYSWHMFPLPQIQTQDVQYVPTLSQTDTLWTNARSLSHSVRRRMPHSLYLWDRREIYASLYVKHIHEASAHLRHTQAWGLRQLRHTETWAAHAPLHHTQTWDLSPVTSHTGIRLSPPYVTHRYETLRLTPLYVTHRHEDYAP